MLTVDVRSCFNGVHLWFIPAILAVIDLLKIDVSSTVEIPLSLIGVIHFCICAFRYFHVIKAFLINFVATQAIIANVHICWLVKANLLHERLSLPKGARTIAILFAQNVRAFRSD